VANIYSRKFGSAAGFTGGPTEFYTVPDGYLAVVKAISIVWGNITISGLDAWVMDETLAKLARYTWQTSAGDLTNYGGTAQWWGAWALDPAEALSFQTAEGTCDFYVSGYLLELP
jgi:hypothetical protein